MARRRTTNQRRDPNIVVEGPGHRANGQRNANGRRPAKKQGPPFIIIGAVVLAGILMTVPFIGMMSSGKEKKQNTNLYNHVSIRKNPFDPEYVAKQPKQWGPVKAGMTMQQVRNISELRKIFRGYGEMREPPYKGVVKEKWTYTVEAGRGGIFHGLQGSQLMVIFKDPPGVVAYVRTPTKAEVRDGTLVNRQVTYAELVKLAKEAGEL